MTEKSVRKKIIEIMIDSTETEEKITEETRIIEDLELSSMEVMVLVADLEDALGIQIPISKISNVHTVGEFCDVLIEIIRNDN
ncbi:MAG: acyl carrier protein [Lachnospiraceae bacterium]|nr:acyl carrier protein [Lachnospiraceae bacterium]